MCWGGDEGSVLGEMNVYTTLQLVFSFLCGTEREKFMLRGNWS